MTGSGMYTASTILVSTSGVRNEKSKSVTIIRDFNLYSVKMKGFS